MECRIFLDTNIIYTDKEESLKEIFNNNIFSLSEFIKENKKVKEISICLPELVFKERLQHKIENINSALRAVNDYTKKLSEVGHRNKGIKPKRNYLSKLKNEALLFLKSQNVKLIPIPKIESDELIERAIHKIKPFKSKGVGFKDTLLFLTLIYDALKEKADRYILCTNNLEDFSEEIKKEFKNKTGKDLIIASSIIELEEKLDEIFTLRLKRKERDEIVKNIIFKKVGDLMVVINKTKEENRYEPYSTRIHISTLRTYSALASSVADEDHIVGYDFNNIKIQNIEEKTANLSKVSIKIETKTRYEEENKNTYGVFQPIRIGYYGDVLNHRSEIRNFLIELECDIKTEEYTINSIKPTF